MLKHAAITVGNGVAQGCQIFLDTIYQNVGKYTKLPQHYQMAIKIYKMTVKYYQ
jgi:hypothetical protein